MDDLITLSSYLGIKLKADLGHVFTFIDENPKNYNSNYIFWSKYCLKGYLANWVFENVGGNGKQLQHFLGQISSDSYFTKLFDVFNLVQHLSNKQDATYINTRKHLYAQAFIGFLLSQSALDRVDAFLQRFFILPNSHLLPINHKKKYSDWEKLVFLCKQQGYATPSLIHNQDEEMLHDFTCTFADNSFKHRSVSITYARKKTIRMALKHLVFQLADELKENPQYQERIANTLKTLLLEKEADRLSRVAAWQAKEQGKMNLRLLKREEKEHKAKIEDKRRRLSKQNSKEKTNTKQTIYRVYSEEEVKAMTTGKRRRLEDLGVLEKSK